VVQSTRSGWTDLLDPQHRVPLAARHHAWRADRRDLLQQHDVVRNVGDGEQQHALAQQPDARRELHAHDLQRCHQHELHVLGLQRLPRQRGRGHFLYMDVTALRSAVGPTRAGVHTEPGDTQFRDAGRIQRRDRARSAQHPRGLRHLRQRAEAQCPGRRSANDGISGNGRGLSVEARLRAGRQGYSHPEHHGGFTGGAPDLGALEVGLPPPHYGPRYVPHWQ